MFLYCYASTIDTSRNVERVFPITFCSIMACLDNFSCDKIRYSSLLKETNVEKSKICKWVQLWRALGKKMVLWWLKQDLSLCQSSFGFSSFKYWCCKKRTRHWWRSKNNVFWEIEVETKALIVGRWSKIKLVDNYSPNLCAFVVFAYNK